VIFNSEPPSYLYQPSIGFVRVCPSSLPMVVYLLILGHNTQMCILVAVCCSRHGVRVYRPQLMSSESDALKGSLKMTAKTTKALTRSVSLVSRRADGDFDSNQRPCVRRNGMESEVDSTTSCEGREGCDGLFVIGIR